MTHSLHRIGRESELKEDYVILAMVARGHNDTNPETREKLIKIGENYVKYRRFDTVRRSLCIKS